MSAATSGGAVEPQAPSGRRRWFPFWVLQVLELAIAVVFVDISIHVDNGGLLVGAAVVLFLLAVTAKGPFGIFRICGQSLHLVLAVVVGVLVAVAPIIPTLRPDIEGLIVVEFGAIGLIRMSTLTMASATGPRRVGRPGPPVIDATARVSGSAAMAPTDTAAPSSAGTGGAARWAGRAAAAASASSKKAAARYGPTAEAGVRRSIRSAGRVVGKATSKPADPEHPEAD